MEQAIDLAWWTVFAASAVMFAIGCGAVAWGFATGEITIAKLKNRPDDPAELVGASAPASSPRRRLEP